MLRKFLTILSLTIATLFGTAALAAEKGTPEEAKAMVAAAVDYFNANGMDALAEAAMDPENTTFHDRDLYVFIVQFDGTMIAHGVTPALKGKNLGGAVDADGFAYPQAMIELAKSGESGWVDYHWPNPTSGKVEAKSTYVTALDENHLVGVGVFKDE
jgi:signal transduction histidine kinase